MGWFTGLFGSTKAAETVVETAAKGIYNGIDKAWYTPEEASETFSNLLKLAYDDNSNRSITRRWMSWGLVGWVLINAQIAIVLKAFGYSGWYDASIEIADTFMIGWAFAAAVSFFFVVQIPRAMNK